MKNLRTRILLLLILLFVSLPTLAQQAATTTSPTTIPPETVPLVPPAVGAQPQAAPTYDPAALAAARQLILVTRSDDMIRQILPIMVKNLSAAIAKENPAKTEIINKLMQDSFVPAFMAHLPEFQEQIAAIYATNLTADDMNQLIAFYKTPVGQKYLQAVPIVMQQTMVVAHVWGKQVGQEAMQKLVDELKKNKLRVPKEMGI
jgi:hypothetical protein